MNIPLDKIVKKLDEKYKDERGILGYMKVSKHHYEYKFIPAPKDSRMP